MKWHLMYEGPHLGHLLSKHIFLDPYETGWLGELTGFQDKEYLWYTNAEENLHGGYYTSEEMAKAKKQGYSFFTNKEKYSLWIGEQNRLHKEAKKLMEQFKLEHSNELSFAELAELIGVLVPIRQKLYVYVLSCQPQCTDGMAEQLRKLFTTEPSLHDELFRTLTLAEQKSFFTDEELDWLDLVIQASEQGMPPDIDAKQLNTSYPSIAAALETHYQNYFLIPASDRTEAWTREHFFTELKSAMASTIDFATKREQLDEQYATSVQKKKEVVSRLKLPSESLELGQKIAEIGYYRFLSSFYARWLGYYLVLVCRRLATVSCYSFEELSSCNEKELTDILIGKSTIDKETLKERARSKTVLIKDGKITLAFGDEAQELRKAELGKEDYSAVKELKGQTGNVGHIVGRAFVMYWNDDISKKVHEMPKGAILVAPQTHPAYMPAIWRSAAIVVDEGGITGHAAIVARELNKPAVIGLHIGTKVIKTGDLIEVDATNGIVRKL